MVEVMQSIIKFRIFRVSKKAGKTGKKTFLNLSRKKTGKYTHFTAPKMGKN